MDTKGPREQVLDQVMSALRELCDLPQDVDARTPLETLGVDSMKKLELLAILEQRLNLTLTEDLLPQFSTPGTIADIVGELLG